MKLTNEGKGNNINNKHKKENHNNLKKELLDLQVFVHDSNAYDLSLCHHIGIISDLGGNHRAISDHREFEVHTWDAAAQKLGHSRCRGACRSLES